MLSQFRSYREHARLYWQWPGATLAFPSILPYVAGILNVTPDSFSDGGSFMGVDGAVAHALAMAEAGADIIDVGGQSTRPGAVPVSLEEEEARVLPVLAALRHTLADRGRTPLLSLDTDKAALAESVLRLGLADILNDESGGDDAMAVIAAKYAAPLILMHRPAGADRGSLAAVTEDLLKARARYQAAGLPGEHIALDPGLGFGKDDEENLALLADCRSLLDMGNPLYIGASRKRFIGRYGGNPEAGSRLGGSVSAALWAARSGAAFVRVHDVRETVEALRMAAAISARREER